MSETTTTWHPASEQTTHERKLGFYWVKIEGETTYQPAVYLGYYWKILGWEELMSYYHFSYISPEPIPEPPQD